MAEPLTDGQQHRHRQSVREFMPTTRFLAGLGKRAKCSQLMFGDSIHHRQVLADTLGL